MCGIAGFVDFSFSSTQDTLVKMTDALIKRGPDESGYWVKQLSSAVVGFGHRRLSIIDLSQNANQPMLFENLCIVFNGEVYNYREIRVELEKHGYKFSTKSDTEVVVKAFHRWGVECVKKFIGMFAIAIFDCNNEEVTLIRDRAGVKPLYWYFEDEVFMFASELKSFHKHPKFKTDIDYDGLGLYFQYGFIPEPFSIFKGTKKLSAGHYLTINLRSRQLRYFLYWDVLEFYRKPKIKIDEATALLEIEEILKSAFNYRMVSDVPVGIFLSGGYDSSLVTAMLQTGRTERLKTFTIGFHETGFDEAKHAKKIAEFLGTDHTEHYCSVKDAGEILPKLPEAYDEPFGDSSAIPTMLVSKIAREKVTVSLSADGGDEIFAGYERYVSIKNRLFLLSCLPNFFRPILKSLLGLDCFQKAATGLGMQGVPDRFENYKFMLLNGDEKILSTVSSEFVPSKIMTFIRQPIKSLSTNYDKIIDADWLSNSLAIDYRTYLVDDILTKVDRATMSVSLEGREPFLDHRLIEYVAQLPNGFKMHKSNKKIILKKIAHKYIPQELLDRPKKGFAAPIFHWFKEELKDYFTYFLDNRRLESAGIFDADLVVKMRDSYFAGQMVNVQKLWYVLMFEMWYEKWIK